MPFMAFSPVWVYSYLKSCVKNGTIRWRNKQAVLTLKAQSDKQPHGPLLHRSGLVVVSAVSAVWDRPDHCYLPLYHPHFRQLTLFRKPQLPFSNPQQDLADVSGPDPWPLKPFLPSSQTVFSNKQPWVMALSLSESGDEACIWGRHWKKRAFKQGFRTEVFAID